jgi:hypothetical protein
VYKRKKDIFIYIYKIFYLHSSFVSYTYTLLYISLQSLIPPKSEELTYIVFLGIAEEEELELELEFAVDGAAGATGGTGTEAATGGAILRLSVCVCVCVRREENVCA